MGGRQRRQGNRRRRSRSPRSGGAPRGRTPRATRSGSPPARSRWRSPPAAPESPNDRVRPRPSPASRSSGSSGVRRTPPGGAGGRYAAGSRPISLDPGARLSESAAGVRDGRTVSMFSRVGRFSQRQLRRARFAMRTSKRRFRPVALPQRRGGNPEPAPRSARLRNTRPGPHAQLMYAQPRRSVMKHCSTSSGWSPAGSGSPSATFSPASSPASSSSPSPPSASRPSGWPGSRCGPSGVR